MEEEKAALYYEELLSKGAGPARFKQGLSYEGGPLRRRRRGARANDEKKAAIDSIRDKLRGGKLGRPGAWAAAGQQRVPEA